MQRMIGAAGRGAVFLALLALIVFTPLLSAATIGTYSGSSGTTTDPVFQNIQNTALAAGHTFVSYPDDLLAGVNYTHLVMNQPLRTLSTPQRNILMSWLEQGGIVVLFSNAASSTVRSVTNDLLLQMGLQNLQIGLPSGQTPPGTDFVSAIFNSTTQTVPAIGQDVSQFIQSGRVGMGTVYVFNEPLTLGGSSTCSTPLCLSGGIGFGGFPGLEGEAPEPGTVALTGLGILALGLLARSRRST